MDRSFYRFVTIRACDGRTDGRTDRILIAGPRLHSMQRGKNGNGVPVRHEHCFRCRLRCATLSRDKSPPATTPNAAATKPATNNVKLQTTTL